MHMWGKGRAAGRVGPSGQTFCRQSRVGSGRVGSGQRFAGSGRVGSKKSDPWTTLVQQLISPYIFCAVKY